MKQLFTTIGRTFVDPWVDNNFKEEEPVKLKSYEKHKVRIPYLTGDEWFSEEVGEFIREKGFVHRNCDFKFYFEGNVPYHRVYRKRKGRVTEFNQDFFDSAAMTGTFFIDDFTVVDGGYPMIDEAYKRIEIVKEAHPHLNCVLVSNQESNYMIREICKSEDEINRMQTIYDRFVDCNIVLDSDYKQKKETRETLDALLK